MSNYLDKDKFKEFQKTFGGSVSRNEEDDDEKKKKKNALRAALEKMRGYSNGE